VKTLHIHQLVETRSKFIDYISKELELELDLLESINKIGKEMVASIKLTPPEPDMFKVILFMACVRIVCASESVIVLSLCGNSADSRLILRSVFELLINILYIEKDPKARSLLYCRHEIIPVQKFLKSELEMVTQDKKKTETQLAYCDESLLKIDNEIHGIDPNLDIPKGINWSGKTVKEMAEEVGLKDVYSVLYWMLSSTTHSTGYSVQLYMKLNNNETIPRYYPNEDDTEKVTGSTAMYSLKILSTVNEYLKLERSKDLDELAETFKKISLRKASKTR